MKLRDKLNTKEKYIENIEFDEKCIKRDLLEYKEEGNNWDEERIRVQFGDLFRNNYNVVLSKYSLGIPVSELLDDYKQGISFIEKSWEKSNGYVQMVEMLSISIMLEVEDNEFNKLTQCVKKDNPNDLLIDFLIHYRDNTWEQKASKFMWNKPYKLTQEIVELAKTDKEKALASLKKYLTQWYKSIEIKTHKSKWNIHVGYWCWEAGALVKILGLDDSSLKDQQYYPYDMVHFKN